MAAPEPSTTCLHVSLVPQWDALTDMGAEAKASSWKCAVCGETFTPTAANELRAHEAERLKQVLGVE